MNIKLHDREPKIDGQCQSIGTCQDRVYVILRGRDGKWESTVVDG